MFEKSNVCAGSRVAVAAAGVAGVLLFAACGSDGDSSGAAVPPPTSTPPSPSVSSAPTTSVPVSPSESASSPTGTEDTSPGDALTGGDGFLAAVDAVWPLDADRTPTVQGYRLSMCAARDYGVTEQEAADHIVGDFAELYGEEISQDEGNGIAAAVFTHCP